MDKKRLKDRLVLVLFFCGAAILSVSRGLAAGEGHEYKAGWNNIPAAHAAVSSFRDQEILKLPPVLAQVRGPGKPLYEQQWFIAAVHWLRQHSPWFERWIWGCSKNMEDFVRNPAEELRDEKFPFCVRDVKPMSLLIRIKFIPYDPKLIPFYAQHALNPSTYQKHYDENAKVLRHDRGTYADDIGWAPWKTKYPNAGFMFQLVLSYKWGWLPIPFAACNWRRSETRYYQFGLGWAPQWRNYNGRYPGDTTVNAVLCGKARVADYTSEALWNPGSEVYGYWEGQI